MADPLLTPEELAFLAAYRLDRQDVHDGSLESRRRAIEAARAANQPLYLGTPCAKGGHRLRTRAGHCAQCDPKKLAYLERHRLSGYVYIAESKAAQLRKVGVTDNIDRRSKQIRTVQYGGAGDWEIAYSMWIERAGEVESRALQTLSAYRVARNYIKDGEDQEARELVTAPFSIVLEAVKEAMGSAER
jgi:hypothetical protein